MPFTTQDEINSLNLWLTAGVNVFNAQMDEVVQKLQANDENGAQAALNSAMNLIPQLRTVRQQIQGLEQTFSRAADQTETERKQ